MGFSCGECMRRFSQVILIITNIFVALLGLCVMIIGIWANVNGKNYVDITDNSSRFTEVSVLIIVLGLFVLIIGGVGVAGAIFASTIFGRITLGLYAIILTLLVICEIAGGIAAAVKKGTLEDVLYESANSTLSNYYSDRDKGQAWDTFQKSFECCGVRNKTDFYTLFNNNISIPRSCCNLTHITQQRCEELSPVGHTNGTDYDFFNRGCVDTLVSGFSRNLGAIAGGAIVLGLIQIFGIVMACFVALYKRDENKYEVV